MLEFLAFIVAVSVVVSVHEWGHYRVARACGVRVLRFSIGFGPVLWRRQAHPLATEFVLSAIPLGGYVRMVDEREGPVPIEWRDQAFSAKPLWQRAAVVAAGPLANFVLAVVIFAGLAAWGREDWAPVIGTPPAQSLAAAAGVPAGARILATSDDGEAWQDVRGFGDLRWQIAEAATVGGALQLRGQVDGRPHEWRLDLSSLRGEPLQTTTWRRIGLDEPYAQARLSSVTAGGAGAKAGLQPGDEVLSVDGRLISDASALRDLIRRSPEQRQVWQVRRAGQQLAVTVEPVAVTQDGQRFGRVGIGMADSAARVTVSLNPWQALMEGLSQTRAQVSMSLTVFGRMLTGQASLQHLGGPVTIADQAGQSAQSGALPFLAFIGLLSVGLGVLNLLPLPMLDGGHLMYYLFEGLTGRPVPDTWFQRLQRAGFVLMLLLMALALSNDVTRHWGQH